MPRSRSGFQDFRKCSGDQAPSEAAGEARVPAVSFLRRLGLAPVPGAVVLDEQTLEVLAELPVGGWRGHVAAGEDAVWLSSWEDRVLARIDARTRAETLR